MDYVYVSPSGTIAVGGMAAAYTCAMFLTGYLSLVRRIKARSTAHSKIPAAAASSVFHLSNQLRLISLSRPSLPATAVSQIKHTTNRTMADILWRRDACIPTERNSRISAE